MNLCRENKAENEQNFKICFQKAEGCKMIA